MEGTCYGDPETRSQAPWAKSASPLTPVAPKLFALERILAL